MRQSFDRPVLRTSCRRCLFSGSRPGHSTDGTIPVADRCSFPPNFVPPAISTTALPLNISAALRSNCDECVLFLQLTLALATPVTLVLLGPKWAQVGAIFAGFTIAAIQFPLSNAANWLLTSQGRGKDIFRVTSINSVLTLASFIVGLPFGPLGVAIAFSSIGLLVRLPILYYITGRTRSCNHLRSVDAIAAASTSLGGHVSHNLVDAHSRWPLARPHRVGHLRVCRDPRRGYLYLHVSEAANGGNRYTR